jgi:DNA-binding transcriptional MerR regulator
MEKSPDAYRTIREVADSMDLPQHVLRFWETRFPQIRPLKRAGGRRYYRPDDIERLRLIRRLLYDEGYTIKGVQKLFKEQGVQALASGGQPPTGVPDELADVGEAASQIGAPIEASEIERDNETKPRLDEQEVAALRRALAEIADAGRILAEALRPVS